MRQKSNSVAFVTNQQFLIRNIILQKVHSKIFEKWKEMPISKCLVNFTEGRSCEVGGKQMKFLNYTERNFSEEGKEGKFSISYDNCNCRCQWIEYEEWTLFPCSASRDGEFDFVHNKFIRVTNQRFPTKTIISQKFTSKFSKNEKKF